MEDKINKKKTEEKYNYQKGKNVCGWKVSGWIASALAICTFLGTGTLAIKYQEKLEKKPLIIREINGKNYLIKKSFIGKTIYVQINDSTYINLNNFQEQQKKSIENKLK